MPTRVIRVPGKGVLLDLPGLHDDARRLKVVRQFNQVFLSQEAINAIIKNEGESASDEADVVVELGGSHADLPPSNPWTAPPAPAPEKVFKKTLAVLPPGDSPFWDPAPKPAEPPMGDNRAGDAFEDEEDESEEPEVPWSPDQKAALNKLTSTRATVTILTGYAGTGKSTVIREILKRIPSAICATTGKAAINVGGCTVDAMFSYDRELDKTRDVVRLEKLMRETPRVIIIDEGSMIGAKMANYLHKVAKKYGKILIIVGDWGQVSPVKDTWSMATELILHAEVVKLTECHRQNEVVYLDALNKVRRGEVDESVAEVFRSCVVDIPPQDDEFIRLYATNATADNYNLQRVSNNPDGHRLFRLHTKYLDTRPDHIKEKYAIKESDIAREISSGRLAHNDVFRVGARVVFTMNDYSEEGEQRWVNGDAGLIVEAKVAGGARIDDTPEHNPFEVGSKPAQSPVSILVTMDRTGATVEVTAVTQEVKDPLGQPKFNLRGFPLSLGWAMTIHKAQGATVDKAWVDMKSITFMPGDSRHGLAYVALSRTRTLAGLKLSAWVPEAVFCAPEVKPFV
jgi:ATP-dependent DNA helicase PIF1